MTANKILAVVEKNENINIEKNYKMIYNLTLFFPTIIVFGQSSKPKEKDNSKQFILGVTKKFIDKLPIQN
jgi:hypothetical protein